MYCMRCGAKLSDTEKKCPLCGTAAFHPDIMRPEVSPLYPQSSYPDPQVSPKGILAIVSTLFLIPFLITVLLDLHLNRRVTWSGYVMGGLGVIYTAFVLPWWFHRPNPVIFTPISFAAAGLFLLYADLATGGKWFLSFAFPLTGFYGIVLTVLVTLLRYIHGGRFYIFGGVLIALGAFMPLMEYLMKITFSIQFIGWSMYPLVCLLLLGGLLIFLGISRRSREAVKKKMFI